MRPLQLSAFLLATLVPAGASGQGAIPHELRSRLVTAFASLAHRDLPQGDTLITWSPDPVLMSTVARSDGRVYSSLVRADGMNGTADARWGATRPTAVHVLWTRPDSTLVDLTFEVAGDSIHVQGTTDSIMAVPNGPWAIADYGMEDQLLPLLDRLPVGTTTISVFRPYGFKWDRSDLSVRRVVPDMLVESRDVAGTGPTFFWLIGQTGALLSITIDDAPESERRPLEDSALYSEYVDAMAKAR